MIGINLIPESVLLARRRRRRLRVWAITLFSTAAVGAFPIGLEFSRYRQVQSLESQRRRIETDIESTRADLNQVGVEIGTLRSQMARADTLRTKRPWSRLLGMFSRTLPEEVWLLSIATDPAAPARGDRDLTPKPSASKNDQQQGPKMVTLEAPRTLALEGFALEYRNLYEFMARIKLAEAFADVTLTRATEEPVFDAHAVRFKILCRW